MGHDWGAPSAEDVWNEIRRLSPWHGGMSYQRLEALDGLQWPCPTEDHPGSPLLHDRLWKRPIEGPPAPFMPAEFEPPVDTLTDEFPMRLTTGPAVARANASASSRDAAPSSRRSASIAASGQVSRSCPCTFPTRSIPTC